MRLVPTAVLVLVLPIAALHAARAPIPNDTAAVTHALERLAFGPRPGDVARVQRMGLARWIDEQLRPERIPPGGLESRLARLETISLDASTLAREIFEPAREARRARQRAAADSSDAGQQPAVAGSTRPPSAAAAMPAEEERRVQRVFLDLAEAKLLRAVYSPRQLEEVLVDFWFNHFNVFARKGQTGIYVGEFERDAIRPHVLGRFRDLLGATAKSPAMLFYLDNWQSAAPDARIRARQVPRGLNENYARELLELHTLGVDGGYTQDDIVNVARAFTGWTIERRGQTGFRFAPMLHDRQAKTVLGHTLPAGKGIEYAERVLDILARHPSTARHIAFKLAQRFVSDAPPAALVDRAAAVFTKTDGNLREVVRAIVSSPEFFDPSVRMAKVKTPFEFVASALRATGAEVDNGVAIVRALASMGMPPYMCQPPTGYDETSDAWVSSGALVNRINFAVALSRGQVRGVRLPSTSGDAAAGAVALGSAEFQKQ